MHFSEDHDHDSSMLYKRKNYPELFQSLTSIHRAGLPSKRGVDVLSNIYVRKPDVMADASELSDVKTVSLHGIESDESLFQDDEEVLLANKPKALKKYKKKKKKVLEKLKDEYPFLDEIYVDVFNTLFNIPSDYPDEYVFLRPGTHLSKATGGDQDRAAPVSLKIKEEEEYKRPQETIEVKEKSSATNLVQTSKESFTASLEGQEDPTNREIQIEQLEQQIVQPLSSKMMIAKHMVDSEIEAAQLAAEQLAKQSKKPKKGKKEVVQQMEVETVEDEIPEPPSKADENREKRLVTKRPEKTTDKLNIVTINEFLLQKEAIAPTQPLAIADLSRLYLILDVDLLIEANRKRRKRRKSSLDREAMNKLKIKEAESKNDRMARLLTMMMENRGVPTSERMNKQDYNKDSEDDDSDGFDNIVNLDKSKGITVGTLNEGEKEIKKKVLIVGDVIRFKKRRIILGTVVERSADEKLMADLVKLGIDGPTLSPNFIVVKRKNIMDKLNEDCVIKEEVSMEEDGDIDKEKLSYTIEELCWLESAIKKFEDAKVKKVVAETVGVDEEEIAPPQEADDMAFSIKTKLSVISSLKDMTQTERQSRLEDAAKKEKPRLLATANIETVEEGNVKNVSYVIRITIY